MIIGRQFVPRYQVGKGWTYPEILGRKRVDIFFRDIKRVDNLSRDIRKKEGRHFLEIKRRNRVDNLSIYIRKEKGRQFFQGYHER